MKAKYEELDLETLNSDFLIFLKIVIYRYIGHILTIGMA